jgi:uncharacterized cupredoxin-like copper-binding protein
MSPIAAAKEVWMYRTNRLGIVVGGVLLLAVACGKSGGPSGASDRAGGRTIQIDMVDTAFKPAEVTVAEGEAVTFRFTNAGRAVHEAFIGVARAQADHEAEMTSPMSHGGHADGAEAGLKLQPGSSGNITYVFDEPGQVEIGCHEPGHYAAGMRVAINVT